MMEELKSLDRLARLTERISCRRCWRFMPEDYRKLGKLSASRRRNRRSWAKPFTARSRRQTGPRQCAVTRESSPFGMARGQIRVNLSIEQQAIDDGFRNLWPTRFVECGRQMRRLSEPPSGGFAREVSIVCN